MADFGRTKAQITFLNINQNDDILTEHLNK